MDTIKVQWYKESCELQSLQKSVPATSDYSGRTMKATPAWSVMSLNTAVPACSHSAYRARLHHRVTRCMIKQDRESQLAS